MSPQIGTGRWNRLKIETSARYRIVVKGALDEKRSGRLGGMTISTRRTDDGTRISQLEGKLADQAALTGVLNTLYDMQLPVLSVECLEVLDLGPVISKQHAACLGEVKRRRASRNQ
jgi:hypothetical protein